MPQAKSPAAFTAWTASAANPPSTASSSDASPVPKSPPVRPRLPDAHCRKNDRGIHHEENVYHPSLCGCSIDGHSGLGRQSSRRADEGSPSEGFRPERSLPDLPRHGRSDGTARSAGLHRLSRHDGQDSDHYGNTVECTVCHSEHKASRALCNECHVVEFPNLK